MRRTPLIAALIYATAAVCLLEYLDFRIGMEQPRSALKYPLMAGIALFAAASVLSFFKMRWATVCALMGVILSWPLPSLQLLAIFGRDSFWLLIYHPDVPTTAVSLLVASVYALFQRRLSLQSVGDTGGRKPAWALPTAVVYSVTMVSVANWPGIWDACLRFRYGR